MSEEMHPFWRGVFDEMQKVGYAEAVAGSVADPVMQFLATPAGAATAAGLSGLGVIGLGRRLRVPGFKKAPPAVAAPASSKEAPQGGGFGWKGLATAGALGAGATYLATRKSPREGLE